MATAVVTPGDRKNASRVVVLAADPRDRIWGPSFVTAVTVDIAIAAVVAREREQLEERTQVLGGLTCERRLCVPLPYALKTK